MSQASYQRQQLALWAAAYINAAGTTLIAFGCSMVKSSADGKYYLTLGAGDGLVTDDAFIFVQPRTTVPRVASQVDMPGTNLTKEIYVSSPEDGEGGGPKDCDLEVAVYRSVTK